MYVKISCFDDVIDVVLESRALSRVIPRMVRLSDTFTEHPATMTVDCRPGLRGPEQFRRRPRPIYPGLAEFI